MKKLLTMGLAMGVSMAAATTASAAPMGLLSLSDEGGTVTVTATTIDFSPPGTGFGTMETGGDTDVDYTGGSLTGGGITGTIRDLPPVPSPGFMTFAGHPLVFDLAAIGPGSATNCQDGMGGFVTSGSCSFTGSPFILSQTLAGVSVSLDAFGMVTDGDGDSNWFGLFTTQLPGYTIARVFNEIFVTNGSITSTYSGSFLVEIIPVQVPEPASLVLLGLGFGAAAFGARRRRA